MIQPVISLPPLDEVARHWHEAEPILRRATDRDGSFEPIDVLALAFQGRMGIWFVRLDQELIAVAATEIKQFPRNRIMQVNFLAGKFMHAWQRPLLAAFEVHARDSGCEVVHAYGRRGWRRIGSCQEIGVISERKLI